jgi:hypothetical protein
MPNSTPIMFNVPIRMKVAIEAAAEEQDLPISGLVRQAVAQFIGYKLSKTDMARARKYATIEERMAAQKIRDTEKRDIIKALLAKYRAGEIEIDLDAESEDDEEDDEDSK